MKNLTKKDYAVLAIAFAMTMPVVCVFNCNPSTWYINVLGLVYAVLIVRKLQTTAIGRAFTMRLAKIEDKVFSI